jgi:hypothetical protein
MRKLAGLVVLVLVSAVGVTQTPSPTPAATQGSLAAMARAPLPPTAPPTTGGAKPAARTMEVQGENFVHSDATGQGSAENVVVTDPDGGVITARQWTWNDRTKVAHASGNLRMTDEQMEATASAAEVRYAKSVRLLVLTGSVRVTLKPKPEPASAGGAAPVGPAPVVIADGKVTVEPANPVQEPSGPEARRYPIEVHCDRVEYRYAKDVKHAVLTGTFTAIQQLPDTTRKVTAKLAEWFGNENRVLLRAPVHFEDTRGRRGDTDEDAELSTKKGAESIRMKKGRFTIRTDEDTETAPQASAPSSKPTAPAAPAAPPDNAKP